MALVVKDRVRETSVTQGTGTFTLDGAVTGYQSFSAIGNGNTTYYTIYLQASNEWEVGIGTYTASGTTLSRDTILASSNGGSVVNFSAGTKDVFVTYPAGRSVYYDTATNVTVNQLSATTVDATNVEVTNIKAKDGTAAMTIADSTGAVAVSTNMTIGNATSDTLTVNATITSNLLFTDNTYDIGASGATRPRNLFLAGNATIGGNTTMTGSLTVDSTTDSSSTTTGSIQTDGGLGVAKAAYIGTTLTVVGNAAFNSSVTLGDGSGDSLTTNTGTWTINNDITINTNLMYWDRANNRVGFGGTTAPAFAIHSAGGGLFSGSYSTATDPVYSGVSLGFEGAGNIGVIASTNPSSATLSLRTKKGATFAPVERININENGVITFRNTNSETSGTQITIGSVSMSSALNIVPDGNVVQNLGSASNRWANVFASTLSDGTNSTMVSSSGANMHLAAGSSWASTIVYVSGSPKVYFNSNGIGVGAASSATDLLLTDGTSTLTIDAAANSEIIATGSTGFTLNASNASGQIFFRTAGAQRGQVNPSGQWTVGGVVSNPAASANLIVNNGTTGASTSGEHILVVGNVNNTVGSERGAGVYLFAQNAATGGSDQASILFAHRNNAGTGEGPFSAIRSYKDSGSDTSNLTFRYGNTSGSDAFAGALYGNGRWGFGSSVTEAQTNTTQAAVSVYGAFVAGQLSPYSRYTYIGTSGVLTARFDDNALVGNLRVQNLGMTSTGHGAGIVASLSTDGTNDYSAGGILFVSTGAYSSTASTQDSEIRVQVAVDGNNTTVATFTNAGNLAMAQADKGIDFSVNSAAAGATSEVLNDYEEGTWTPTILYGGSDTGQTYAIQNGRYVKVGSIVHAQGYAQVNVTASATGTLSMGGFPFQSANVSDYRIIGAAMLDNAASAIDQPVGQMSNGSASVTIVAGTGANNATGLTDTVRGASFRVFVSITYRVN